MTGDGVEGVGIVADGIKATHQTTHRCTRDDVYGQAGLLNHFQRTDMGNAFGTAATENDGYLLTFLDLGFVFLCKDRKNRHHSQQQTSYLFHIVCKDKKK